MAISLGFWCPFATFIILLLVPAVYLIVDDIVVARETGSRERGGRPVPVACPQNRKAGGRVPSRTRPRPSMTTFEQAAQE